MVASTVAEKGLQSRAINSALLFPRPADYHDPILDGEPVSNVVQAVDLTHFMPLKWPIAVNQENDWNIRCGAYDTQTPRRTGRSSLQTVKMENILWYLCWLCGVLPGQAQLRSGHAFSNRRVWL